MTSVDDTRHILGQSLGEIMDYCQSGASSRAPTSAANAPERAHQGILPVGMRAMDQGQINNEVREGLLIAQAAERTLRAVEATEAFLEISREFLLQKDHYDWRRDMRFDDLDSVFSHIGLSFDTDDLIAAQATWHLAVLMENHERRTVAHAIAARKRAGGGLGDDAPFDALDRAYLSGFRRAAAQHFDKAAEIIAENGMGALAENLRKIAGDLRHIANGNEGHNPAAYAKSLLSAYKEKGDPSEDEIALMDTLRDRIGQIDALARQEEQGAQDQAQARRDFF